MKVKIGNKFYNPEEQPIMIILEEQDKKNIANMARGATKYCVYPESMKNTIEQWMGEGK